ncbi:hypothetical protein [Streptomyces solicathayae]|uniref:Uncharacterized protein n=1 Tax=Streptomyces solicathayae TaxID=3081768 RepID=A0ABZ0LW98_9ACTN|nr:hypothetical protein [Streptomyces sp. HUAS YS2]WOX23716.1 hypothetical protein R2D22_20940 [Streptomyces sp. HUAS YS2]
MAVTFQKETVDPASVRGQLTLALSRTGVPHIVYTDSTGRIKYARKEAAGWVRETLPAGNDAGGDDDRVCLALDSQGNPHIAYRDLGDDHLIYGVRNGAWSFEEVPTQGGIHPRGARHISLGLHPDRFGSGLKDTPHLAYHDMFHTGLGYAAKVPDDDGHVTWKGHVKEVDNPDSPHDAGLYTSLVFDADETISIAYFDDRAGEFQRLKLAVQGEFAWEKNVVGDGTGLGECASMAPGLVGRDAVGYYDVTNKCVTVWIRDRDEPPPRKEVVAADVPRGARPSTAATPTHALRVAYEHSGLRFAVRTANDTWEVQTVDTAPAAWPSLAYDGSGTAHLAYVSGGALKYARGTG